ncbi:hypothetical protein CU048_12205 [Beijerinckiaceae bacterium]|nr:hypothetical protein CU048_12205 [Beijerinckiaceae bacterium]
MSHAIASAGFVGGGVRGRAGAALQPRPRHCIADAMNETKRIKGGLTDGRRSARRGHFLQVERVLRGQ